MSARFAAQRARMPALRPSPGEGAAVPQYLTKVKTVTLFKLHYYIIFYTFACLMPSAAAVVPWGSMTNFLATPLSKAA